MLDFGCCCLNMFFCVCVCLYSFQAVKMPFKTSISKNVRYFMSAKCLKFNNQLPNTICCECVCVFVIYLKCPNIYIFSSLISLFFFKKSAFERRRMCFHNYFHFCVCVFLTFWIFVFFFFCSHLFWIIELSFNLIICWFGRLWSGVLGSSITNKKYKKIKTLLS